MKVVVSQSAGQRIPVENDNDFQEPGNSAASGLSKHTFDLRCIPLNLGYHGL